MLQNKIYFLTISNLRLQTITKTKSPMNIIKIKYLFDNKKKIVWKNRKW